jgi:hypothetical protein
MLKLFCFSEETLCISVTFQLCSKEFLRQGKQRKLLKHQIQSKNNIAINPSLHLTVYVIT